MALDDGWEVLYGLDPAWPNDAASDPDNDGMSNLVEFLSGTNPRDPLSLFRIELADTTDSNLTIQFTAQPGRAYGSSTRTDSFPRLGLACPTFHPETLSAQSS